MSNRPKLLVINTGSSSVKYSLYQADEALACVQSGKVIDIGERPVFSSTWKASYQVTLPDNATHEDALRFILDQIGDSEINIVAHRVVHGGSQFKESVVITSEVLAQLKKLSALAPLHQPHNLAAIDILAKVKPGIKQVACFDTAFHAGHEDLFNRYALNDALCQTGIRRYGFHGLSYEWIAQQLKSSHPQLYRGRVIAAHLGNGASLCAMKEGRSIDTTMGMTALDGLPMGTRCGSLDPGAVTFMMRELGMPAEKIEQILYNESGLLGLSEISSDVRRLLEASAQGNLKAKFALDYFALKTAQFIGMMAVASGGVDGIVFTGGIGENAQLIRDDIVARLNFLQPFEVMVIPTNEERIMAQHALRLQSE